MRHRYMLCWAAVRLACCAEHAAWAHSSSSLMLCLNLYCLTLRCDVLYHAVLCYVVQSGAMLFCSMVECCVRIDRWKVQFRQHFITCCSAKQGKSH